MLEKLQKLMQDKRYEKVVRLAFSADGPLADNAEANKIIHASIGYSFTYQSDIIQNRDEHYKTAAEWVIREITANEWQIRRK